jgi:hypothetical protein
LVPPGGTIFRPAICNPGATFRGPTGPKSGPRFWSARRSNRPAIWNTWGHTSWTHGASNPGPAGPHFVAPSSAFPGLHLPSHFARMRASQRNCWGARAGGAMLPGGRRQRSLRRMPRLQPRRCAFNLFLKRRAYAAQFSERYALLSGGCFLFRDGASFAQPLPSFSQRLGWCGSGHV